MEYKVDPRKICVMCGRELPIDMFEVLLVRMVSPRFTAGAKHSYEVRERSYSCKDCGSTTQSEWIKKWRQNS